MIKHLILLKIRKMIDFKELWVQWFIDFFINKTSGKTIKNENISVKN